MECYKAEAFRAKELAEKKVLEKDFAGARVLALKAQNLFPGLNGLSELLEVINIYVNFEKTTNGEVDWYAVLGVDSLVDDEKLRRHCAKMATSVHPDYNHSCGANGAFRIIMQAWSMFADHAKRATYDRRRRRLAMATSRNVFCKSHATSKVQLTSIPPQPPLLFLPGRNTFWTKCSWCNMQFEYSTVYLHKLLKCVRCHSSFLATEERSVFGQTFPNYPSSEVKFFPTPSLMRETPHVLFPELKAISSPNICDRASNGFATVPSSSAQTNEKGLNRKRRVDARKLSIDRKRRMMTQILVTSTAGPSSKSNDKTKTSKKKLSHSDVHDVLIGKAVLEIKKKLDEWKVTNDEVGEKENFGMKNKVLHTEPENLLETMTVPDSEFHDFDKDRMEDSFQEKEVWAVYDCDDGMPRYYAMIKKLVSRSPFKASISWLNSKSNSELGQMKWVVSGFPKTSGDFWIGKSMLNPSVNIFSHQVNWSKGSRGVIKIYPCKGDVWALYSEWSSEWNEFTPNSVVRKYETVQILEEFNEDGVARVVPLVKVHGYRSVFKQHEDPDKIWSIPKQEIFRLSHQIPKYVITGLEGPNAPSGGFLELDPAALPPELLQVIDVNKEKEAEMGTNAQESEVVDNRFRLTYFRKRKRIESAVINIKTDQ